MKQTYGSSTNLSLVARSESSFASFVMSKGGGGVHFFAPRPLNARCHGSRLPSTQCVCARPPRFAPPPFSTHMGAWPSGDLWDRNAIRQDAERSQRRPTMHRVCPVHPSASLSQGEKATLSDLISGKELILTTLHHKIPSLFQTM